MIQSCRILIIITFFVFFLGLVINSFLLVGRITISTILIFFLLLPFGWLIWRKYEEAHRETVELGKTVENLETKNKELSDRKEVIEQTIDTVEDIAVFSYNKLKNEFYISKGVERIFGFSHKEAINNPYLLMGAIHPEDKENQEKLFLSGQATTTEFRVIRPDGDIRWVIQRKTPVIDSAGNIEKNLGSIIDITNRKMLELQLKHKAYYDDLTDLANRSLLERHLKKALARSKRHEHTLCIMFIDLDGFKKVNDTLGHDFGDLLLKEVANRLVQTVRDEDFIARLGGDEFIIIFEETNKAEIESIAQRILEKISEPYLLDKKEANISPSIGISIYPDDGEEQEVLITNADRAMYFAKSKGKSNFQFYFPDIPEITTKKSNLFEKIINQFTSFTK